MKNINFELEIKKSGASIMCFVIYFEKNMLNKTGYIVDGSSGILLGKQNLNKQYAIDFTNQKPDKLTLTNIKYENFEMHLLRNDLIICFYSTHIPIFCTAARDKGIS